MKRAVVLVLLVISFFPEVKAEPDAAFHDILAQYQQQVGFSGAALVVKNGQPLLAKAVGHADDAAAQPVMLQTRFDIGSIQKDLTAVLVLQAHENNLLSLDDTLDEFSFGFADSRASRITIRHLLEHCSGFGNVFTAEYRKNPAKYSGISEKLALLQHQPLLFEPGSDREYSNYGYIVLGAILEKVTGQDYWELLEKGVLQPSRAVLAPEQLSHGQSPVATPYHFSYEGKRLPVVARMREHKSPDGGGQMSVYELYAFYHRLFAERKLLSASSLRVLKALQDDQQQWLAFGGGNGVSAAVELDFANDTWVIVLANTDRLVAEELSARLRSLAASGRYAEVRLPATLFAYQQYLEMGGELFSAQFDSLYQQAGYRAFIGKTVTDLARELIAAGKAEESIYFFKYLVDRYPNHAEVYDGLAYGYISYGKGVEARVAFAKARELNPDYRSKFDAANYEAVHEK
jgi:CubicO group peptidase (beta-lactamase class C family)